MSADAAAAAASTPTSRSAGSSAGSVKLVTTVIVTVVGLTFLFSFGNIFALGLRLDLSVVGLLLGTVRSIRALRRPGWTPPPVRRRRP